MRVLMLEFSMFIQASTYQVAVLLQYNYRTKYTLQQLVDNTQIDKVGISAVFDTFLF
jgi:hypothetical protein